MSTEFFVARIALIVLSGFLLSVFIFLKAKNRIGNQFFGLMMVFWFTVLIISFRANILDSVLDTTGLVNRSQFLFGISIAAIIYLLYLQTVKSSKNSTRLSQIIRRTAILNFKKEVTSINEPIDVLIIITAKDEGKTIGSVIDKINLIKIPYSYKILVVNDGSRDDTEQIAKSKGALVISNMYNLGVGAAVKTGYIASKILKPQVIINIDGDGQHDPKYITELISKIKKENADLVYASRFSKKSNYKTIRVRSVGIKFYSNLVNKIGKISLTDVTSGYRGIKYDKLSSVYFVADSNFAIELAIRAARAGLKITEIPSVAKDRAFGISQFHKLEIYIIYNINAIKQIFNAFFSKPNFQ